MGAGKTAIGRQLARLLRLEFKDSDLVIQERTGVDIPFIFEKEGETGFRRREARVIDELSQGDNFVMATGGGAILAAENRRVMSERGIVVYLHASVATQLARTRRGRHRPLLDETDPAQKLSALFAVRDPLYRSIANHVVLTDNHRVPAVARKILQLVESA